MSEGKRIRSFGCTAQWVSESVPSHLPWQKNESLKVTEQTHIETRLAGTFLFSHKHIKRHTTGHFFAMLTYQPANNFPTVRGLRHVDRAVLEDPALLEPDKSVRDQTEGRFFWSFRRLQGRLRECGSPPLVFVVDVLDERTSETRSIRIQIFWWTKSESEPVGFIFMLAQALCDPGLPITRILVTSQTEGHIREAMQNEDVHSLVGETSQNFWQGCYYHHLARRHRCRWKVSWRIPSEICGFLLHFLAANEDFHRGNYNDEDHQWPTQRFLWPAWTHTRTDE